MPYRIAPSSVMRDVGLTAKQSIKLPNYWRRSINLVPESLPIGRNVADGHDAWRERVA